WGVAGLNFVRGTAKSIAVGNAVRRVLHPAAAVLVAQVVVRPAPVLNVGRLGVAPGVVRAGRAGQLGRAVALVAVALEINGVRGGASHGLEVRRRLCLPAALLDARLAVPAAGLAQARALQEALAAGLVRGRGVGGEGLITRAAPEQEEAGQDRDREKGGHTHGLVSSRAARREPRPPAPFQPPSGGGAG